MKLFLFVVLFCILSEHCTGGPWSDFAGMSTPAKKVNFFPPLVNNLSHCRITDFSLFGNALAIAPKSLVNRSIYLLFIWIQLVQWKISCGVDHGTWQSVLRITQWVPRPGTTLHHCWVQHRYHTSPAIVVSLKHGNYFARSSYKN